MPGSADIRSGHYPHQAAIDAYGDGGFRFADMSHRGSMLCLASGMFAWDVEESSRASLDTLTPLLDLDPAPEVMLFGLGEAPAALDADVRTQLRERGMVVEAMGTGAAVRTYNVLFADGRSVGAALIAVSGGR